MDRGGKEQQRRDRLREYDAHLDAARAALAVVAEFVRAREAREPRPSGRALEAEFAAQDVAGVPEPLPAAVWVGLRQADLDAVVGLLVELAGEQFVVAEHEQLASDYRLTTVPECRGIPDVGRLVAQVAAFLRLPGDVIAVVAGWGADDPRTHAEIAHLLDARYGPPPTPGLAPAPTMQQAAASAAPSVTAVPADPSEAFDELPTPVATGPRARLSMSRAEFAAVLALTPEQRAVFGVLTREADICISAEQQQSSAGSATLVR